MPKNSKFIISIIVILVVLGRVLHVNAEEPSLNEVKSKSSSSKKLIVIDPGHGGFDGGGFSKTGILEKGINLNISFKLREELKALGYDVLMTREEDKLLYDDKDKSRSRKTQDLWNRCKIKNESNCDMFISIHLNMFPQSKYYGAQVWYSKLEESKKLAHILQKNLKVDLKNDNKRVEKAALNEYRVLKSGNMPSVIIECGFLSNVAEAEKLNTEEYQILIAKSIAKSVAQYYGEK
jgi:N-acetylmuramoyl-L-alanine amidase